jgi:plastocyanin
MKKSILILLILFAPLVYASPELLISPNNITATTYYGQNYVTQLTLTNTGNETMYNIAFNPVSNVAYSNIPTQLAVNQSAQMTVTITPSAIDTTTTGLFYTKTTITATPQMQVITATNSMFNPSFINIRQNDTIQWTNSDTNNHTATATDFSWSYTIAPSSSATRQFTDIAVVNYLDTINNYGGVINVSTNQIDMFSHDSNKDKPLIIKTTAQPAPTSMQLDVFTSSFSIGYNEIPVGVLRVQNTGSGTALHLRLAMNWTQFSMQDFNLNTGQYQLINFNITPQVTSTSQTNKSYSFPITLSGDNINPITATVTVFINYHDFGDTQQNTSNTSNIVYIINDNVIRDYCLRNPSSCPTTNISTIVYQDRPLQFNITQSDWNSLITDVNENKNFRNEIKSFMAQLEQRDITMNETMNNLTTNLKKNTDSVNNISNLFNKLKVNNFWWNVILSIMIFFVILIVAGIFLILRWKSEQDSYVGL